MGGPFEPGPVAQHADPGRGEKAHFGGELAGLFAAVIKLLGEFQIEKHDGLADSDTIFGAAEAQHINAGLPGDFLGGDAEGGHGIGKAGAVHVQVEAEAFGDGPNSLEFIGGVNGADLGGLGEADGTGFGIVDIGAAADHAFHGGGGDFAMVAGDGEEFGAIGKEFGRAAFIGVHVGEFVAQNAVVGLAEGGEGQGIGGGAVKHKKDFAAGLKQIANHAGGLGGPGIIAVGLFMAVIGGGEDGPGFGADPRIVIAGELAAAGGDSGRIGISFA